MEHDSLLQYLSYFNFIFLNLGQDYTVFYSWCISTGNGSHLFLSYSDLPISTTFSFVSEFLNFMSHMFHFQVQMSFVSSTQPDGLGCSLLEGEVRGSTVYLISIYLRLAPIFGTYLSLPRTLALPVFPTLDSNNTLVGKSTTVSVVYLTQNEANYKDLLFNTMVQYTS